MRVKKFLAVVLAAVLAASVLPVAAFAAGTNDVWGQRINLTMDKPVAGAPITTTFQGIKEGYVLDLSVYHDGTKLTSGTYEAGEYYDIYFTLTAPNPKQQQGPHFHWEASSNVYVNDYPVQASFTKFRECAKNPNYGDVNHPSELTGYFGFTVPMGEWTVPVLSAPKNLGKPEIDSPWMALEIDIPTEGQKTMPSFKNLPDGCSEYLIVKDKSTHKTIKQFQEGEEYLADFSLTLHSNRNFHPQLTRGITVNGIPAQAELVDWRFGDQCKIPDSPIQISGRFFFKLEKPKISGSVGYESNPENATVGKPITAIVSGGNVGSIPESALHYYWDLSEDGGHIWYRVTCMDKSYTPLESQAGQLLKVTVAADGYDGWLESTPIEIKKQTLTGTVTTSPGTACVGKPITAIVSGGNVGSIPESALYYYWELSDDGGSSWYAAQCMDKSYTPLISEAGQLLKVTVEASGCDGWLESAPIEIKKQTLTGTVTTDSAAAYVGRPITAIVSGGNVGSLPESALHYEWFLGDDYNEYIYGRQPNGTEKTYIPSQSDLDEGGWYVNVEVTADGYTGSISCNAIPLEKIKTVDSVSAYITAPVAGAKPDYSAAVPEGAHYTADVYNWYRGDTWADRETISSDYEFQPGETYWVWVEFWPAEGYEMQDSTQAGVNGGPPEAEDYFDEQDGSYNAVISFTLEPAAAISSVSADITPPAASAKPDYSAAVPEDSHYTVAVERWIRLSDSYEMTASDKFKEGEQYSAALIFTADPGYEFTEDTALTVNGSSLGTLVYYDMEDEWGCFADFDCTEAWLSSVYADITPPAAGAKPDYSAAVPEGAYYTADVLNWYRGDTWAERAPISSDYVFRPGETYWVWVEFWPAEGYEMQDSTQASVNGGPPEAEDYFDEQDGSYNAVISFTLEPAAGGLLGDANLDGMVDAGDAVLILRHDAQLIVLTGQALANADTNRDGSVDAGDAVLILRYDAQLITGF